MKTQNQEKIIQVNPALFKKWRILQSEAAAAKRAAIKLQQKMNLPVADNKTKGKYVITNSRGDKLGKYTINFRKGFKMPECFIGRLS